MEEAMPKLNGFKNFERRLRGEPDILETQSTGSGFGPGPYNLSFAGRHTFSVDEGEYPDEEPDWIDDEPYDDDEVGLYESDPDDIGYIEDDPNSDSYTPSERQERVRWVPLEHTSEGYPTSYHNQYGLRTSDLPSGGTTTTPRSGSEPFRSEDMGRFRAAIEEYYRLVRSTTGEQEERVQSVRDVREGGDSSGEDSL
jgi:hypothetical protein